MGRIEDQLLNSAAAPHQHLGLIRAPGTWTVGEREGTPVTWVSK